MASNEEVTISLTYWVDEKKNRVIVAEASGDFVDVLFVKNRHSLTLKFSLKETLFFAILSIVFLSVVYLTIERASYL